MTKNYLQLLDILLIKLQETTEKKPIDLPIIRVNDIHLNNLPQRDWENIVNKLVEDKMITSLKNKYDSNYEYDGYYITFDGLLLLQLENGYEGRHKASQLEKDRIKSIENRQTFYSCILAILTGLTVLTAIFSCYISYKTYIFQTNQNTLKSSCLDTSFCIKKDSSIQLTKPKK